MSPQAPFLNVSSFVSEEEPVAHEVFETSSPPISPFLRIYEEEDGGQSSAENEEYAAFLNNLYDEELDEALFELAGEARDLYETQIMNEVEGFGTDSRGAERLLEQHFAPLAREIEEKIGDLAKELGPRDIRSIADTEIDMLMGRYEATGELSPSFENFFGKVFKAVKKVAKGAVDLAKKGISAAAKLGLGPVLNKLKALIKPLLDRVIKFAMGKLPAWAQPMAKKLAERIPSLKELEVSYEFDQESDAGGDITEIQLEFDREMANLLFAPGEVEMDLELAEILTEAKAAEGDPIAELEHARVQFIDGIGQLEEGEDPAPYIERFIPAILPALKLGIKLAGRPKVVGFLANYLNNLLVKKIVGQKYGPMLSKAIVDAGLRLIHLEATAEDESLAAGSAVAATVEDTVGRIAALPEYILDDPELLEGFVLEAIEDAAAANLPPILSEEAYRMRPNLRESRKLRGTWIGQPLRGGRRCYKKYSRIIRTRISPHKAMAVKSFGGVPLAEFLDEQLGISPGEELEAEMHLFESVPGTTLSEVALMEADTPGLGSAEAYTQLHPLTMEAAGILLGEPGLGREVDPRYLANHYTTKAGQRFYCLGVRGKRPIRTVDLSGKARMRRMSKVNIDLDFRNNQIRIYLYLSEIRAQNISVKLRTQTHTGTVAAILGKMLERGMRRSLTSGFGLKIIHESVTPGQWLEALKKLPSQAQTILLGRIMEWTLKGLPDQLKANAQQFIAATEGPEDGVTLKFIIADPPGFAELGQALKGKALSLTSLKLSDGAPNLAFNILPGYKHE